MRDITTIFNKYKEAARHLGNTIYSPRHLDDWDIREDHDEMCILLFKHIVLNEVGIHHDLIDWMAKPAEMFQLEPVTDMVPIMINREKGRSHGYWDHPKETWTSNEFKVAFIDYFDWDALGTMDYRYYNGFITSASDEDLLGREVLVETQYAKVFLEKTDAEQENPKDGYATPDL